MPSLSDIFDSALAGYRGVTQGVTGGLARYPAAVAMMGMDKVMGRGKMTYDEALQAIREQDAQDRAEHPYARIGGEVAGGLGQAIATGGGGMLAQVGKSAGLGAVNGFTANGGTDNALMDTATGAGLGALFGAGGAKLAAAQVNAARAGYLAKQQATIDKAAEAQLRLQQGLAGGSPSPTPLGQLLAERGVDVTKPAEVQAAISSIAQSTTGTKVPRSAFKEARTIIEGQKSTAKNAAMQALPGQEVMDTAKGPLRYSLKGALSDAGDAAMSSVPGIAGGALAGAGLDVLTPDATDPWAHAKQGAYLGGLGRVLVKGRDAANRAAQVGAAFVPLGTAPGAARLTTVGAAQLVPQSVKMALDRQGEAPAQGRVPWEAENIQPVGEVQVQPEPGTPKRVPWEQSAPAATGRRVPWETE